MVRNEPEIPVIVDLYAMISIMRDVSSPRTLTCAERVMHGTAQTYFEPNITARELHQQVKEGKGIDPLKEFSETARAELRTLHPSDVVVPESSPAPWVQPVVPAVRIA